MGTEICSCYGIYRKYFAETNFFLSFKAEEVQYTESDISYFIFSGKFRHHSIPLQRSIWLDSLKPCKMTK